MKSKSVTFICLPVHLPPLIQCLARLQSWTHEDVALKPRQLNKRLSSMPAALLKQRLRDIKGGEKFNLYAAYRFFIWHQLMLIYCLWSKPCLHSFRTCSRTRKRWSCFLPFEPTMISYGFISLWFGFVWHRSPEPWRPQVRPQADPNKRFVKE